MLGRVFEALLLEVGYILKTLNRRVLITYRYSWRNDPTVLNHAKTPIDSHETDTHTITHQHSDHSSGIRRGLILPERLRSNKIANSIANVQDGKLNILFSMSGCVGLSKRDANDVRSEVGVAL
jgi:metal-dependent hydrolase (beta-lactamase superfamily II)